MRWLLCLVLFFGCNSMERGQEDGCAAGVEDALTFAALDGADCSPSRPEREFGLRSIALALHLRSERYDDAFAQAWESCFAEEYEQVHAEAWEEAGCDFEE